MDYLIENLLAAIEYPPQINSSSLANFIDCTSSISILGKFFSKVFSNKLHNLIVPSNEQDAKTESFEDQVKS